MTILSVGLETAGGAKILYKLTVGEMNTNIPEIGIMMMEHHADDSDSHSATLQETEEAEVSRTERRLKRSRQQAPSARCHDLEETQGHGGDGEGRDGERGKHRPCHSVQQME